MVRSELIGHGLLVQRIEPALMPTVRRLDRTPGEAHALVVLEDGSAVLEGGHAVRRLAAPVLCWLNRPAGMRLSIAAGSAGHLAEVADETLIRALGELSDGSGGGLIGRGLTVPLSRGGEAAAAANSLSAIEAELAAARQGAGLVVSAHLRILVVALLRLSGFEEVAPEGRGANARFLRQFRQLVESNFRDHWPVARYARAIGISHDRLHSICRSALGKAPKALLNERLAREAGLGLERSTLSIEQLSHALGFHDPAHFSHFFKRMTGQTPGAFRRIMARADRDAASPANFADWP